ncbi:Hypothetical predicted protein [Marmota monax]|uniref:Uncharacterized protein n=1 Tax=Marmota monax TaxID=9995 RepID=A0A5E4BLH2_MARMO|nr:hypothetical protein GHT09_005794 [Marmota monax]VTJ70086.1 Hypothetical predicted protein [Marmota monax]
MGPYSPSCIIHCYVKFVKMVIYNTMLCPEGTKYEFKLVLPWDVHRVTGHLSRPLKLHL